MNTEKKKENQENISPNVMLMLKQRLGYQERTIRLLASTTDEIDSITYVELLRDDPAFKKDMIMDFFQKRPDIAKRYYSKLSSDDNIAFDKILEWLKENK